MDQCSPSKVVVLYPELSVENNLKIFADGSPTPHCHSNGKAPPEKASEALGIGCIALNGRTIFLTSLAGAIGASCVKRQSQIR